MVLWSMVVALVTVSQDEAQPLRFEKVVLDAEHDFEAAGVADVDRDGHLDVISGSHWYRAPDWTPIPIREIPAMGGYRLDFANVMLDVDGDRFPDVVSCNWHHRSVVWRRNPGRAGGEWSEFLVDAPGNMETALRVDVDGDGRLDFLPDVSKCVVWYRVHEPTTTPHTPPTPSLMLVRHEISTSVGGHGLGFGDVDGDGRADVLKSSGWFGAPEDRRAGEWNFHAEWNLGSAGIGILVHDVQGDGLADVIHGNGHAYGLYWQEQGREGETRTWTRHVIDESWSQAHCLQLVDLDGDGRPEVLTGKRRFAHNGNDPGGKEPSRLVVYRFDATSQSFTAQVLDEGTEVGTGLAMAVEDVDGDGRLDIVAPGKTGLFLFLQR